MRLRILGVIIVCGAMLAGCVTKSTHVATLTELEQAQKALTKTAAEFDAYKKQTAEQIAGLEANKTNFPRSLSARWSAFNRICRTQSKIE